MITGAVVEQPPVPEIVYVTVYVPTVLVDGTIAPVAELSDNPDGDEVYTPPAGPVCTTGWALVTLLQYGEPG